MGFEILMAVLMKTQVFWNVALYSLVNSYRFTFSGVATLLGMPDPDDTNITLPKTSVTVYKLNHHTVILTGKPFQIA
jgi:hypothetical protein